MPIRTERLLDESSARLPPEAMAAAQESSRNRRLEEVVQERVAEGKTMEHSR